MARRCFGLNETIQLCKLVIKFKHATRKYSNISPILVSRNFLNQQDVFRSQTGNNRADARLLTTVSVPKPAPFDNSNIPSDSPYELVQSQIDNIYQTIPNELAVDLPALTDLAEYYFLGARGKAYRPLVILLVASLCNKIMLPTSAATSRGNDDRLLLKTVATKQQRLAMICEMIHTASLIHDDVIDASDMRRGQPTLHKVAGEKKAILTGDYILAVCCKILAGLRNPDVIVCVAQVVEDLVKGELVQMSQSFAAPNKRFDQYLHKTYLKTASLIANSSKAVAIFAQEAADLHATDEDAQNLSDLCYSFGRNVGMAFQVVDDLLDYAAKEETLGKPAAGADLRLGIATAPVLYAADAQLPNSAIHERISRRFTGPDDYRLTFAEVMHSNVLDRTRELAAKYAQQAETDLEAIVALAAKLNGGSAMESFEPERRALKQVCDMTLNRDR